jgi:hypothetical protein
VQQCVGGTDPTGAGGGCFRGSISKLPLGGLVRSALSSGDLRRWLREPSGGQAQGLQQADGVFRREPERPNEERVKFSV